MKKRPISITVLACVYIAMGAIGFGYHFTELVQSGFRYDLIGVELVRLAAIVAGIFMLRARNWARWLALVWIAFHAVLSLFHTWPELAMHCLFFIVIAWLLFRPAAVRYFRPAANQAPQGLSQ